MAARYELTRLETQFFEAAKTIDKLANTRKALAASQAEMGNKLVSVASTEGQPQLANALRKFGRAWHVVADSEQTYVSRYLRCDRFSRLTSARLLVCGRERYSGGYLGLSRNELEICQGAPPCISYAEGNIRLTG